MPKRLRSPKRNLKMPTLKLLNLKPNFPKWLRIEMMPLDEISRCFVEGFNGTVEQFKLVQLDIDKSVFDPFKSVIDRKIVDDE
ncbi:hypothetical protein VNO80_06196 [Phaseolus coccineus]|uniref:Uncharacterized protein n=1 Tax=Phaseolus coccineus TaxID=3886 RepID=A0AAN9NLD5_PHACN